MDHFFKFHEFHTELMLCVHNVVYIVTLSQHYIVVDNVVCTDPRKEKAHKEQSKDLQQRYHIRSALTAQREVLERLGTSLYPRHLTCTAKLAQQSSICLINLDSFVGVTVSVTPTEVTEYCRSV